jgi:hypothetical protein
VGIYLKRIKNWYNFASRVWLALGAGWIALPIALTSVIKLEQAGALLICGAIIAEVFHNKRHRLYVEQVRPNASTSYVYREIDAIDIYKNNYKAIETTAFQQRVGKSTVPTHGWILYQLAINKEFRDDEGSRLWDLDRTLKRVESKIDYSIVVSVIVGTLFWAFAG